MREIIFLKWFFMGEKNSVIALQKLYPNRKSGGIKKAPEWMCDTSAPELAD